MIQVESLCQLSAALVGCLVALKEEGAPQDPVAVVPTEEHSGLRGKLRHTNLPHGISSGDNNSSDNDNANMRKMTMPTCKAGQTISLQAYTNSQQVPSPSSP